VRKLPGSPNAKYIAFTALSAGLMMTSIVIATITSATWFILLGITGLVIGLLLQYRYLYTLSPLQQTEAMEQGRFFQNFVILGTILLLTGGLGGTVAGGLTGVVLQQFILHSQSEALIVWLAVLCGCIGAGFGLYLAKLIIYSNDRDSN
jgi:hypothetical protein